MAEHFDPVPRKTRVTKPKKPAHRRVTPIGDLLPIAWEMSDEIKRLEKEVADLRGLLTKLCDALDKPQSGNPHRCAGIAREYLALKRK